MATPAKKTTKAPKATDKTIVSQKTGIKKAVAKEVAAKTAKQVKEKKSEPSIYLKYEDKSAGQPELAAIFQAIKKMMTPYHKKGAMWLHENTGGQANLVSHKAVEIAGRPRKELWFISVLVQKGYVGFYYMPIYAAKMKDVFTPEFMKCLKGKACFHIRKKDPAIMAEIKKAIEIGYKAYAERGWV